MRLKQAALADTAPWLAQGYRLPKFNRAAVTATTAVAPQWVHFGAGNIFRAFPAALVQNLLEQGAMDRGIIVAEGYDGEIIEKAYRPMDNLSLNVTLKADGSIDKTVLGSVTESWVVSPGTRDWQRLLDVFAAPSLQLASFTITEKGYCLTDPQGACLPAALRDFAAGPQAPESYIGKLAALCYHRFLAGGAPLSLVSMDNCSHNGARLSQAVLAYACRWEDGGLVQPGFSAYLRDPNKIAFPWSMIDKITPRPDAKVKAMLEADGFEDTEAVVTSKNTYVAPFVNAEQTQYLVIEDWFPNGRPPLERAGVIFTDRRTVELTEKMKVGTCLNPLHTAMALFGCLLGYTRISDEMQDSDIVELIKTVGYTEGLPVVVNPGILDPKEFLDTVVNVRFVNPYLPDTPQRIATDTSQKLAVRFGETLKAYLASKTFRIETLRAMPLVFAAFCRYQLGVDDQGRTMALSPDPLGPELAQALAEIRLGDPGPFHTQLAPILSNPDIFGVDLYQTGLGSRVEALFTRMVAGPGAVRATLRDTLCR